ncbi:MAG: S8 family serine peptidase [Candidatus Sericytochromatia bacterium]|nr:S8 family serine peptidase [Candidatus Sericytochromatia bacterium]
MSHARHACGLLLWALGLSACQATAPWNAPTGPSQRLQATPRGQADPLSAIVRWKPGTSPNAVHTTLGGLRLTLRRHLPALNASSVSWSSGAGPSAGLMASGLVAAIEPNHIWRLSPRRAAPRALGFSLKQAEDPGYAQRHWGQTRIGADRLWSQYRGAPRTLVAVIDTGIDLQHPDLRGALVPGFTTFAESSPQDYEGHGTHVAGIIAGQGSGQPGVRGVAPDCRIMPIKVMGPRGREGRVENVVAGIIWAVDHGAQVLNMSLGDEGTSPLLRDAIRYARERDVVVVAASGNFEEGRHASTNTMNYPAALPGVIAVGAVDDRENLADFSFWGHWLSVTAPGVDIHSSVPADGDERGAYMSEQGTSMAAPFVAGVAALVRSRHPDWNAAQVQTRLEKTAHDLGAPGYDPRFGHGRLDAYRAVLGP